MNKETHTNPHRGTDVAEGDALFADLQAFWDGQSSRIERTLSAAGDRPWPAAARRQPAAPGRLRMLAVYAVLSAVALAAAVYWGVLFPTLVFNTASLVTSLIVEAVILLLLAGCLYWAVGLLVHDPARVGVLRMSRFREDDRVRTCVRQAAAACVAAVFTLTVASCTTTGIDGHAITQDHHGRAAAVEHVEQIIALI
ncbi:MAG: hypothetical protein SPL12_06385 [Bacteroidales bacterium]|nr:hypothetical protein [Bacteroidales bacterium]